MNSFSKKLYLLLGFLLPFVAAKVSFFFSTFYQLQLFDLSRILIFIVFFLFFYKINFKEFKKFYILLFVLVLSNIIAFISILYSENSSNVNFFSVLNFPFSAVYYILIPLLSISFILSFFEGENKIVISFQVINISNLIVLITCLFQLNSLFNIIPPVSYLYNKYLFFMLEGRWQGWDYFLSANVNSSITYLYNISSSPIVMNIKRLSGTFQEPASLAIYCSIMMLPFLFSYLEFGRSKFFKASKITILLSPVVLFFTLSSTGYLIFIVNVFMLLCSLLVRKNKLKFILILSFLFLILVVSFPYVYDKLYVLDKLYSISDDSSSTRYGSIIAALNLFISHPLGVGYGFHPYYLSDYIPIWSKTIENSRDVIALHSFILRIIVDFGVLGLLFILSFIFAAYNKFKLIDDKYLKCLFKYMMINILILSFTDLPFNEVWIIFIFYLLFCVFPKPLNEVKCI